MDTIPGVYIYRLAQVIVWLPAIVIGRNAQDITLITGYDYLRAGLRHMNPPPAAGQ